MMSVSIAHDGHMSGKNSILEKLNKTKLNKNSIGPILIYFTIKVRVKMCYILHVSTIYCSTLAAIMMAVSFTHHCQMSSWLSGKNSML